MVNGQLVILVVIILNLLQSSNHYPDHIHLNLLWQHCNTLKVVIIVVSSIYNGQLIVIKPSAEIAVTPNCVPKFETDWNSHKIKLQ